MLQDYLKKKIAEKSLKVNSIYINIFLKYLDVIKTKELFDLIRQSQAVVIDKDHVKVTSIHLKAVTYLQSPHVMIRNISNDDGCNTKAYGCECYLLNRKSNTKKKYCCFGISIDIINEIIKLQLYTKELQETLSGIKHASVEILVLEPDTIYPNGRKSLIMKDLPEPIDPLEYLKISEADLVVGSHVIVNKINMNSAILTRPYFSSPLGLMIYRTDKLKGILAFLYPFHWSMWVGIFITIQLVAVSSTIYEWLSPYGQTPRGRNRNRIFSFSSALTLCWSALFSHTVRTKSPKCWSSRFLMNVYACFCLIFLASYTAKLAAYMVGKNAIKNIAGIHDPKITSGDLRLGTILASGADYHLQSAQPHLYKFMKLYINSDDCIEALRKGDIDVFVYDFEALQYFKRVYFREQFEVVGKPFGQLLYTIALSKHLDKTANDLEEYLSKIIADDNFSKMMFERIRLWTKQITGIDKSSQWSSDRLRIHNFSGPLIIFSFAMIIGFLALFVEYLAFKYTLPWVRQRYSTPWCLPISQRFHRHILCETIYKKSTYTERHLKKNYSDTIGERLINHRRISANTMFELHDIFPLKFAQNYQNHRAVDDQIKDGSPIPTAVVADKLCRNVYHNVSTRKTFKNASTQFDESPTGTEHADIDKLKKIVCLLVHENSILSLRLSQMEEHL